MATVDQGKVEVDEQYERYARPLEREHWGEFIAIARGGETLLADSFEEVMRRAVDRFGRGQRVRIFRIGPRVVGRI